MNEKKKHLLTWLGNADCFSLKKKGTGPLKQVLETERFDVIYLLSNREKHETEEAVYELEKWTREKFGKACPWIKTFRYNKNDFDDENVVLDDPTDYEHVYMCAEYALKNILPEIDWHKERLTFFATPGTPIMIAALCLLAERIPHVSLIQSSEENGVKYIPWYIPDFSSLEPAAQIGEDVLAETADYFKDFVSPSAVMEKIIHQAKRYAVTDAPILLLGESGTGKEEFAKRIHKTSMRNGSFKAVNCGAIPEGMVESELFGHAKGAFTGAVTPHKGIFEQADGGTVFLDEIGDLPLKAQVKLLRVIQEKEVMPLGSENQPVSVDVRIVAATHKDLKRMVRDETFREDLYYRLAVLCLQLPPLRDRGPDIMKNADRFLNEANDQVYQKNNPNRRTFSISARSFISKQKWPGNFRQLKSVILSAVINSTRKELTDADIRTAMSVFDFEGKAGTQNQDDDHTSRDAGMKAGKSDGGFEFPEYDPDAPDGKSLHDSTGSFNLKTALKKIKVHYIKLALKAKGNKNKASKSLGQSYQSIDPLIKKYDL